MQAKVQELDTLSKEQTSQIATLREELQGSLAELDQVTFPAYFTHLFSIMLSCLWHTLGGQLYRNS